MVYSNLLSHFLHHIRVYHAYSSFLTTAVVKLRFEIITAFRLYAKTELNREQMVGVPVAIINHMFMFSSGAVNVVWSGPHFAIPTLD